MKRRIALMLVVLILCCKSSILLCDDDNDAQRDLRTSLRSKILTLKHFYGGESLQFSTEGVLKNPAEECAWTLCAQIQVDEINLESAKVQIIGKRVTFKYDEKKKMLNGTRATPVSIEIETAPGTANVSDIMESFNKIFLSPGENLADVVPAYWKAILSLDNPKKQTKRPPAPPINGQFYRVESISAGPPEVTSTPSPSNSGNGQPAKGQGIVLLSLVVNTQGQAEDISIIKPLGLGLDEKAVEKVQQWKFKPAIRNGVPVPVRVAIEITFRLY